MRRNSAVLSDTENFLRHYLIVGMRKGLHITGSDSDAIIAPVFKS